MDTFKVTMIASSFDAAQADWYVAVKFWKFRDWLTGDDPWD